MEKELSELLSLLETLRKAKWLVDEHTKALWFDTVLEKYRVFAAKTAK
jgi:hypothetical protein